MRREMRVLFAVSGLAVVAAGGVLLGVPAGGVMLALVMGVCTAAIVQAFYHRQDQFLNDHQEPEFGVRRRHGHEPLSEGEWPWP